MLYLFLFTIFPNCYKVIDHNVTIFNQKPTHLDTVEVLYFDETKKSIEIRKELYDLYYGAYALMCEDA